MNNTMTVTSLFDKIEKPSKPHIMDSQVPVTKEELNERLRKTAILESVGISSSRFDGDDEHEDEDELQLRLLLSEGKAVPDELLERIKIRIHILRKINKCRGGRCFCHAWQNTPLEKRAVSPYLSRITVTILR